MRTLLVVGSIVAVVVASASARAATFEFNRARGKPATQTSTAYGGSASRAVDGNVDGNYWANSVTHTAYETEPYLEIDLGGVYNIDRIELFNRTDCCRERLEDVFVFYSLKPMPHRSVVETFQQDEVTTKAVIGQLADQHVVPVSTWARYVRVQLGGTNALSLAEVKVIEKVEIAGPQSFADKTTWVPTGAYTGASEFAAAEMRGQLRTFHRGSDGRLHVAHHGAGPAMDQAIESSPQMRLDSAPAVAVIPGRDWDTWFVAIRGIDDRLWVGWGTIVENFAWIASWEPIAFTQRTPSIVAVGQNIVVGWLQDGNVRTTWRNVSGSWQPPRTHLDGVTGPTLHARKDGLIGMAWVRWEGSVNFVQGSIGPNGESIWTAPAFVGITYAPRLGLATNGKLWMISAVGNDRRPYVAVQQYINGTPTWNWFERAWGNNDVPIIEPPQIVVHAGLVFIFARDTSGALRYWMRNPNTVSFRYADRQMWLGGRVVSGFGVGATPPAIAAVGRSTLGGIKDTSAELYVFTRGIDDRQLYALNFSRFVALDVLQNVFFTRVRAEPVSPDWDPKYSANLFEVLVGLVTLPTAAWDTITVRPQCPTGSQQLHILLAPGMATGQARRDRCPPELALSSTWPVAPNALHEFMHIDHGRRPVSGWPNYFYTFETDYAMSPRFCQSDTDCGGNGAVCTYADAQFLSFDDPWIRRWAGRKVCLQDGRPQGFASFYALSSVEHNFIETATAYRWEGQGLRAAAERERASGNSKLWDKYQWIKTYYYDGIEYSGSAASSTDRDRGERGLPLP